LERRTWELESFQDYIIKESIKCKSVSADLDTVSESAILWMTLVDDVGGLCLDGVKKDVSNSRKKEN
jgi:hypothetical protein